MKLTFLGTGTSTGVPQIGCNCRVCSSEDPRDKRLRCSALVETDETRLLLDCGPDFRQQMLRIDFKPFDAVLLTHEHYDHVGGLDDLRPYSIFGDVRLYAAPDVVQHLKERLPYCFAKNKYPGVPKLDLHCIAPHEKLYFKDAEVTAIRIMHHAQLPILGYRINNLAYITDMKTIPDSELDLLRNLEVLVVNGLRHTPHNSHQSIEEACAFADRVGARQTYLIHMGHNINLHAEEERMLPPQIHMTYDGLKIEF